METIGIRTDDSFGKPSQRMLMGGDAEGNAGLPKVNEKTMFSSTWTGLRRYRTSSCLEAFHKPCENFEGNETFCTEEVKTFACGPPSGVAQGTRVDTHGPVATRFASPEIISAVFSNPCPIVTAGGRTIFVETVTVIVFTAAGKGER
jgi:hypothetical protein